MEPAEGERKRKIIIGVSGFLVPAEIWGKSGSGSLFLLLNVGGGAEPRVRGSARYMMT